MLRLACPVVVNARLAPFGTSVFAEMSRLALEHGAINLSQGFPDFEGPTAITDAVVQALKGGLNQYARSQGALPLVEAIAQQRQALYGLRYDPLTEVVVFSGATEGLMASMLGILEPRDEVILFEPVYDSYPAAVALAGAIPRYATLRFPDFRLDLEHLASLFNDRTKLVVLNTPHNPTGKVYSDEELSVLAELCQRHDVAVLADEVYEHLTYDGIRHRPLATFPGMRERTLALSSTGKTYNFTGWKIGWGTGPAPLVKAAQAAHQFMTFASATPIQHGVAYGLTHFGAEYYASQRAEYQARRDFLLAALQKAGFKAAVPQGAYFILADYQALHGGDDLAFARMLTQTAKVAAIPPSSFYPATPAEGRRLVRFAFCKKLETLQAAAERLEGWRR